MPAQRMLCQHRVSQTCSKPHCNTQRVSSSSVLSRQHRIQQEHPDSLQLSTVGVGGGGGEWRVGRGLTSRGEGGDIGGLGPVGDMNSGSSTSQIPSPLPVWEAWQGCNFAGADPRSPIAQVGALPRGKGTNVPLPQGDLQPGPSQCWKRAGLCQHGLRPITCLP